MENENKVAEKEYAALFAYGERARMDTENQVVRYQMAASAEVYKAEVKAEIEIKKAAKIAEIRSDIASQRELQKLELLKNCDGEVFIKKKIFVGEVRGQLNVVLVQSTICRAMDEPEGEKVLWAEFRSRRGRKINIFFKTTESPKRVAEKFSRAGIFFGFKANKEIEALWYLFISLLETDKICDFPTRSGWNMIHGKISYVFPENLLWQEVLKDAK